MLDKIKINKKEKVLAKAKTEELDEQIIDGCRARNRLQKDVPYIKYKKLFQSTAIGSFVAMVVSVLLVLFVVFLQFDEFSGEALKKVVLHTYLFTIFACLLPYIPLHFLVFLQSYFGKYIIARGLVKNFYKRMDKVIYLCHQHSEMMLVSRNNVQIEYYLETSQIFARQALLKLLRLTNVFIREKYYDFLDFKKRKTLSHKIEYYVKELNGSLIMTYKGKMPKFLTDAFEQISMNLIEIRKREAKV